MTFTIRQLADFKGVHPKTFSRYLKEKKFKKRSIGRFYSTKEAKTLAKLFEFDMPKLNGHKRT